jgi:hypothetical protein
MLVVMETSALSIFGDKVYSLPLHVLFGESALKFTYGFATKTVKARKYVYFWKYTGTGHKTEQYIGPAGKARTNRRMLQVKLEYLQGLQEEITETIRQVQEQLAEFPSDKMKKVPAT